MKQDKASITALLGAWLRAKHYAEVEPKIFEDHVAHRILASDCERLEAVYISGTKVHHDRSKTEIHLKKIAEMTGLCDANEVNLKNTVENNILKPLQEHGYIQTYSAAEGLNGIKYIITRKREKLNGQHQNHGSVN